MNTSGDQWRRWRTSIEEFERHYTGEHRAMSPQFRERWERVKAMQCQGDEWWGFSSPDYAWRHLAGCQGIELIRDGEVIAQIVTVRS